MIRTIGTWIVRLGLLFVVLIGVLLVVAAVRPVPRDPTLAPAAYGAGARSVEPSETGLQREFPPMDVPSDTQATPETVELGRLLFFDPILSADDDMSCATCHHPDYGFSDGLPRAIGAGGTGVGPDRNGGVELMRNTPSLWNVGYAQHLFWDGRVDSLEEQSLVPLMHSDEMGVEDGDELVAELAAIPEYTDLFAAAFGGEDAVTLENVQNALAAFQRTLVSDDSPFDRYAAGDTDALTAEQRRGLNLFRSAATRCFECHMPPTFASDTFRVIGVPDVPGLPHDPGRAGVVEDGQDGAFKVVSLRNVALSAPYMHNGIFETLEEVVEFYADGGGRAHGIEDVDSFVRGFEFDEREREDLVAFLHALTDESKLPEIPDSVPSGLPVVPRLENPARDRVAAYNVTSSGESAADRAPRTITVQTGESIQDAVDRARPGDTIEVPYGIYEERVVVDVSDLTLLGVPDDAGEWPVLDGIGALADGVIASGNNFEMANFVVRNYTDNGVLVEGVRGVHLHDIVTENTGVYGIYPVHSSDVLLERLEATGVDDAGIYAGQSENVVVRDSVAYGNVIGIEVENTHGFEVYDNHTYDNSVGIFIDLLPQLTSKVSLDGKVYNNLSENNNHPNFAPEDALPALLPPGLGMLILAGDGNDVYDNTFRGNRSAGLAVFSLAIGFDENEIDVGPNPEDNRIHDNTFENNGYDPAPAVTDEGLPGADILWDGTGAGNRFDQPNASSFPPVLPTSRWPTAAYRAYWNTLNAVIRIAS